MYLVFVCDLVERVDIGDALRWKILNVDVGYGYGVLW